jgi:predicted DNA-binding WGR domain protein
MAQSGTMILKSFQSFMVNDGLLEKVVEAIKAGEKEARTTGNIQTFEVFYKGFRQNIAIGRVMVIPAKVADSREDFPLALLYGCMMKEFGGEEMADIINYKIGDTEFDEYSKADLAALKDKIFKNKEGKYESLVLFAPSWLVAREFVHFKFTKDDEALKNLVRHLVFSAYYDPRLSSAFNSLMTDASTDQLDVTNVTPKLNFPGVAENPLKDYPDFQKMGAGRKKIFLTKKTADKIEQSQLEPEELNVFQALNEVVEKSLGVEPMANVAKKASEEEAQELIEDFCDEFSGDTFEWIAGREKGMRFHPYSVEGEGDNAHLRGSYEKHPQFGNIPDDIHQVAALLDDIERGQVRVLRGGSDVTRIAKKLAEAISEAQNDYDDDGYDDDYDEDEDEETVEASAQPTVAVNASKKACGQLPVVRIPNVGPGAAAQEQELSAPSKTPEGVHPIGIELNPDGTPKREEAGKQAAEKSPWECSKCHSSFNTKPATHNCNGKAAAAPPQQKGEEISLYNQQNGSDKEYRVVMTPGTDGKWTVEAFNGRRGKATTKAQNFPGLNEAQAKAKYEELIAAKIQTGYTRTLEEQRPQDAQLEDLPTSGGHVIQFENATQVALFQGELIGQMSDGAWENASPMNHWRPMSEATVRVGKPGMNFVPMRTYDYASPELLSIVGDRWLFLAKATKAYPSVDFSDIAHAVDHFSDITDQSKVTDEWEKKYVEKILQATGETDFNQFLARVHGQQYGMGDLRKDLRAIKNVVNGKYRSRFASKALDKKARGDEHMNYKGHDFRLAVWRERDNLQITLMDDSTDQELGSWSDEDARQMFEDGFFDSRNLIGSVVEYLETLGALNDIQPIQEEEEWTEDDGEHLEPVEGYTASSKKSREAAQKHLNRIAKNEIRQHIAEEVPSADNILSEVLTDMGQAPAVDLPNDQSPEGADNRSTTSEAQVPAEMKSETPEKTKAEPAPEAAAKPWETKASTKRAARISDVMDILEGYGRFGRGSKLGATVAEDIAQARGELDFDKSSIADNSDVDQGSPNELFGKEAAMEAGPGDVQCLDCGHVGAQTRLGGCATCGSKAVTRPGDKLYVDTSDTASGAKVGASTGARHDDVPVAQGETESGDQPESDLNGDHAPEQPDTAILPVVLASDEDAITIYFANSNAKIKQNAIGYLEQTFGVEIGVGAGFINVYTANAATIQNIVKWLEEKGVKVEEVPELAPETDILGEIE